MAKVAQTIVIRILDDGSIQTKFSSVDGLSAKKLDLIHRGLFTELERERARLRHLDTVAQHQKMAREKLEEENRRKALQETKNAAE